MYVHCLNRLPPSSASDWIQLPEPCSSGLGLLAKTIVRASNPATTSKRTWVCGTFALTSVMMKWPRALAPCDTWNWKLEPCAGPNVLFDKSHTLVVVYAPPLVITTYRPSRSRCGSFVQLSKSVKKAPVWLFHTHTVLLSDAMPVNQMSFLS